MAPEIILPGCVRQVILAGWTGRDRVAQEKHMAELELLGVRRPPTTPVYYRVSAARVTTSDSIEATGNDSSGEVEFVMLQTGGALWIGVGSDHTDRKVETYNITVSKQMCDKPVAREVWLFSEVSDHWDSLVLRSWMSQRRNSPALSGGQRCLDAASEGLDCGLRPGRGGTRRGTAMFGGTLPAIGGIQSADRFDFELEDPVRKRRLAHGYEIRSLPVAG